MAGDANFDKVALLLHGDGADAATSILDSSLFARTVAVYGGGSIRTAQAKFGGASIRTASGGLYLTGSDTALHMGGENFTVECFIRPDSTAAGAIINNYGVGNSSSGFVVQSNGGGVISASLYSGGSATTATSASNKLVANVWQHLAVVRNGSTMVVYLDGVSIASVAVGTTVMNTQTYPTRLGMESNTGAYPASAYFDEVRITKGVARYTSGFTPPSSAFANYAYLLGGAVEDSVGTPAARTVRAYREDTGAFIGSALSNATTGLYEIQTLTDAPHTLISYPAVGENLPALTLRGVLPA